MMRSRSVLILSLVLIWLPLAASDDRAQEAQPTEYQIKSAFLFNFAMFVEWPERAFAARTSPFVIGVLGENPFHDDLARTVQNKKIDDHPLLVREILLLTEATNCHLLFISASEKKRWPEIFQSLQGTSVLTVSEVDRFTQSGGMINFVLQGTKIRFQINKDAATAAGLKVSSKLMNLSVPPK
jgi:hypothetical protein